MKFERRIAVFLKEERKKSGMRYVDFANKLGITHSALQRYEACEQSMTLRTLQQIMQRLKVSLIQVLGEEEVLRVHGRRG